MNTLDIKVPYKNKMDQTTMYSLRDVTNAAIEIHKKKSFRPLSFTPEVLDGVVEVLIESGISQEQSKNLIHADMAQDFGYEVAEETFRYCNLFNETYEELDMMSRMGLFRQAFETRLGKKLVDFDPTNSQETLDELINDFNKETPSKDNKDDNELDSMWNNW